MGVMSGTLDLVQRAYLGSEIRDGVLYFRPRETERLDGLALSMRFRGMPIEVSLAGSELTVAAQSDPFIDPIEVGLGDEVHQLGAGESCTFTLE